MSSAPASPFRYLVILACISACGGGGDGDDDEFGAFPGVNVPANFVFERVIGGLTYPTAVAWDDQGLLYVLEAGGQFLDEPVPARLLRVEGGIATPILDLESQGIASAAVGLAWHDGGFYVTHRSPADRSGSVSKVALNGTVTTVLTGFNDSQGEHQINDVRVGPDGRVYVCVGPATNSGVVGIDLAPFVTLSPDVHATPCQPIVLTGQNYETPDFRTADQSDTVLTGAFVPFGVATTPGELVPGSARCGSAIHSFDPTSPAQSLGLVAWGLRNVIGIAWGSTGDLYASVNGYDVRGSRPFADVVEPTYRIVPGAWYGFPDFSSRFDPITDPKFDVANSLKAAVVVGGQPMGKDLTFVIDHAASGLSTPNPSVLVGEHAINSSPSKLDVAPASWGSFAGHLFVAEWGDLAPATTPLQDGTPGYRVVRIDPNIAGAVASFLENETPGPGSGHGMAGQALERPFDVRFGPDDAMYVVDFGIARVNPARVAMGQVPYEFPPQSGAIWRVRRVP